MVNSECLYSYKELAIMINKEEEAQVSDTTGDEKRINSRLHKKDL